MPDAPLISVVMAVHDGEAYLADCLDSVVGQTLASFELIVVDDGSRDGTRELIELRMQRDRRVRLVVQSEQQGLSRSLNRGIAEAAAPLIARMDADDLSHPDRLRWQWNTLRQHPDAVAVGTLWLGIDGQGRQVRPRDRWALLRPTGGAPFPHGSIAFRKTAFLRSGGYREALDLVQDFDLYLRLARAGRILVIPEALYSYRFHPASLTLTCPTARLAPAFDRMRLRHAAAPVQIEDALASNGRPKTAAHLYFTGASRMWAGLRPAILKTLVQSPSLLGRRDGLKAALLGVVGSATPRLVRWILGWAISARDRVAGRRLDTGKPQPWQPE